MTRSIALAAVLAGLLTSPATARTCGFFTEVRTAIDEVIDKDAAKGAAFRKGFKEGLDPIHLLEQVFSEDLRKKMDICRFDTAEYLTKRGFPPSH